MNQYTFSWDTDINANQPWCIVQLMGATMKQGKALVSVFFVSQLMFHSGRREHITAPGPNHRLCSVHFSKQSYTKDPDMMVQLGMTYKLTLHPDAKPDAPVPDIDIKDGEKLSIPTRRGAFEKRRKAEILQMAFDSHVRAPTPENKITATTAQLIATDVPTCTPSEVKAVPQPNMPVETPPPKPSTSI
ncbi:unnamed protein product [Mytilus coruscus]|uniref:THAP-type domain-containing protein n=1 Tax=Mytilus coruscus TaxID=42192 RepID=A0A6J8AH89_MYTCO|nr:unnamed protein product [Mytilus coruscus]